MSDKNNGLPPEVTTVFTTPVCRPFVQKHSDYLCSIEKMLRNFGFFYRLKIQHWPSPLLSNGTRANMPILRTQSTSIKKDAKHVARAMGFRTLVLIDVDYVTTWSHKQIYSVRQTSRIYVGQAKYMQPLLAPFSLLKSGAESADNVYEHLFSVCNNESYLTVKETKTDSKFDEPTLTNSIIEQYWLDNPDYRSILLHDNVKRQYRWR